VGRPAIFTAGMLDDGDTCPYCQAPIRTGQRVGRCQRCQSLQHESCWESIGECCSYECAAEARPTRRAEPDLVITRQDVANAPDPVGSPFFPTRPVPVMAPVTPARRLSGLAVAALVVALVGIVLFGVPGLVSIALGAIAIGRINVRKDRRGLGLAFAAIVIGALSIVGWTAGGVLYVMNRERRERAPDLPINPPLRQHMQVQDLAAVNPAIRRAIRANVLIVASARARSAEGSGVVLARTDGRVFVLTNRHVADGAGSSARLEVTFSDGVQADGRVVWRGPTGLDAVVVECTAADSAAKVAPVRAARRPAIGEPVFAVGNPFGLGWSYIQGAISAIRTQAYESGVVRLIQTQLPLNPGNSGGGLYDEFGALIGLNTMTTDKQTTEGIGFAIAIADLVPLLEQGAHLDLTHVDRHPESPTGGQP